MATKQQQRTARAKSAVRTALARAPKKARGSIARAIKAVMKRPSASPKKASPKRKAAKRKGKLVRRYTKVFCDTKLVPHFRKVAVRKKLHMKKAA